MADQKPSVEVGGELQRLQPADRLDTTFTNDRLPTKTGILQGWVPSIDTSTTVDFSAGDGWLVDNETDPLIPTHVRQTSGSFLAETVLNVATETFTFFYIDAASTLQQQNTAPTRVEFRTKQFIAVSYQLAGALVAIYPAGQSGGEGDLFAYDILATIGIISEGNFYDKATDAPVSPLNLKVSAGTMGYANANRGDTVGKRRDPHFVAQSAVDPVTWTYFNNDGSDGISIEATGVTLVDTANRSDGAGSLTALSSNRSGLAVVYRDPTGNTVIEYTIADFNIANTTAQEAFELAVLTQPLVTTSPPFEELYVIEYPKDAADLDDCVFHRLTSDQTLAPASSVSAHNADADAHTALSRVDGSRAFTGEVAGVLPTVGASLTTRTYVDGKDSSIFRNSKTGLTQDFTGLLSINVGDDTKGDIAASKGHVLDFTVTPDDPPSVSLTWTAFTAVDLPNIATEEFTTVYIEDTGGGLPGVFLNNILPTPELKRSKILLGVFSHTNNTIIDTAVSRPIMGIDTGGCLDDFLDAIGDFNINGNVYDANGANLLLDRSAGKSFGRVISSALDNPHEKSTVLDSAIGVYGYSYQDGSGKFILEIETQLQPQSYDDGDGVLGTVTTNDFTIQRLIFDPRSEVTLVEYGQKIYNTLVAGIDGITENGVIKNPGFAGAVLRGWLICRNNVTDLAAALIAGTAVFREALTESSQPSGAGVDLDAIHVNLPAEISTIATKTAVVGADIFASEDSEDSFNKKQVALSSVVTALTGPDADTRISTHNSDATTHTALSRVDGTRAFTGEVAGVTPTAAASLATMGWADGKFEILAAKNAASGYAGLSAGSKLTGSQQLYGTGADTACEGNDSRLSDSRPPNGSATGDLGSSYPGPTVEGLRGRAISATTPTENQFFSLISDVWTPTSPGSGTDGDAIHDNVDAEISAITEETTPLDDDVFIMEKASASFSKRRVKSINMPGSGGGGGGSNDINIPALDLEVPFTSATDWSVNVMAPADLDPQNTAINVRSFDDAVDNGCGKSFVVPAGMTNMTITVESCPISAPAGTEEVEVDIYFRTEPFGALPGSWGSKVTMDTVTFPITDRFYLEDATTKTLVAWGITAGDRFRFELVNDASASSLARFWLLRHVKLSFS